jgi:hypothetical protein
MESVQIFGGIVGLILLAFGFVSSNYLLASAGLLLLVVAILLQWGFNKIFKKGDIYR